MGTSAKGDLGCNKKNQPLGRGAMKFAKGKARRATQLFGRKVSFNRVVENARPCPCCQLMICKKLFFYREILLPNGTIQPSVEHSSKQPYFGCMEKRLGS